MDNLHTFIHTKYQENKYLLLLTLIMLACAPSAISFEWLALRPMVETKDFFSGFWKLIFSHFTHSNWPHLFINITNLVILRLAIKEWAIDRSIIIFVVYSALVISIGLHIINSLTSYVGFSGIFYSLLIYILLTYRKHSPKLYSFAIIIVALKIAHEQWYGASSVLSQLIETNIAIDAHALGVFAGFSFWVLKKLFLSKNKNSYV